MASIDKTITMSVPDLREFNKVAKKLQSPNAWIAIDIIGNGYLVHNTLYGWTQYYSSKQDLITDVASWLKDLPDPFTSNIKDEVAQELESGARPSGHRFSL